MSGSSEGFLNRGVTTCIIDYGLPIFPSEKEILASLAIISENTDGQSLSSDVGMKSMDDDFEGMDVINQRTSSTETLVTDSNDSSR